MVRDEHFSHGVVELIGVSPMQQRVAAECSSVTAASQPAKGASYNNIRDLLAAPFLFHGGLLAPPCGRRKNGCCFFYRDVTRKISQEQIKGVVYPQNDFLSIDYSCL